MYFIHDCLERSVAVSYNPNVLADTTNDETRWYRTGDRTIPPPLVYNVPVRETKAGSKVETLTMTFRR